MRIRRNPDGTRELLSFSHFGPGDGQAELRRVIDDIEESNRQIRETPEKVERKENDPPA